MERGIRLSIKVNLRTEIGRFGLPVRVDGTQTLFERSHLTERVYKVVLQKLVPPQIRQLILYHF